MYTAQIRCALLVAVAKFGNGAPQPFAGYSSIGIKLFDTIKRDQSGEGAVQLAKCMI
jgi:hypothetical protein